MKEVVYCWIIGLRGIVIVYLMLTPDAFSIRKRANDDNPWIGTFSGSRSEGYAFVGDITGGLGICLHDFWQSYPSTIEISDAKSETAVLTAWLWSPETEPMDLRHYDNVSHTLSASYEDVQEGMSTPYGISRTSTLTFIPQTGYSGRKNETAPSHPALIVPPSSARPPYLNI